MLTSSSYYGGYIQTEKLKKQLEGKKRYSNRLTHLVFVNSDGSEKVDLMAKRNAKHSRSFRKKTGKKLGFDYYYKKGMDAN